METLVTIACVLVGALVWLATGEALDVRKTQWRMWASRASYPEWVRACKQCYHRNDSANLYSLLLALNIASNITNEQKDLVSKRINKYTNELLTDIKEEFKP